MHFGCHTFIRADVTCPSVPAFYALHFRAASGLPAHKASVSVTAPLLHVTVEVTLASAGYPATVSNLIR